METPTHASTHAPLPETMRAVVNPRYGSPEVLELREVPRPAPGAGEVLVEVHAAAANPLDWHFLRGSPWFMRLSSGLLAPRRTVLGADVAGRVVAVGEGVGRLRPGDAVFGEVSGGGFAEYLVAAESRLVAKPAGVAFEAAAAAPVAALTALQGLRDKGRVAAGEAVLINGASGGVGTSAVQIARAFGARVTGVCSGRNAELVRSLGAEAVIDYTREEVAGSGRSFDLVFDAVGNLSVTELRQLLAPGGRGVVVGFQSTARLLGVALRGPLASRRDDREIGLMGTARPNPDDLQRIAELLASGALVPVIDRVVPLADTAEAIRYLETGRARGKVIVAVRDAARGGAAAPPPAGATSPPPG